MAAEESYLAKMANDVLQGAEDLTNQLEEGFAALFSSDSDSSENTRERSSADGGHENYEEDDLPVSPLEGIAESVLGDIMSGQQKPQGFLEHLDAFRHAITWSESFILGLLAFQVSMLVLTVIVSRKKAPFAARLSVMIFIAIVVRLAERLNGWGAQHWRSFSTQNYFDGRGVFISIMLCAPLMFDCLVMLLCFLWEASQLLVQVKTEQLKRKQRQERQEKKGDEKKKASKKDQ